MPLVFMALSNLAYFLIIAISIGYIIKILDIKNQQTDYKLWPF